MAQTAMALNIMGAKKEPVKQYEGTIIEESSISIYKELAEIQKELTGTVNIRAKIPAGGGKLFDIIAGGVELDKPVSSLRGVIIRNYKCNAMFSDDGGNNPPICSSTDGELGFNTALDKIYECKTCKFNKFGSSTKANAKGKACKNLHRLYIIAEDCLLPIVLSLPPTSLQSFNTYRTMLVLQRLKPHEAVTEFTLSTATSSAGNKYSVVNFKLLGSVPPKQLDLVNSIVHSLRLNTEFVERVSNSDYSVPKEISCSDADAGIDEEDLPFDVN